MLRGLQEPIAPSNVVFVANDILFHDVTLFFAIISGIIYSRNYPLSRTGDFYYKRLRNVALPYAAMTVLFTALMGRFLVSGETTLETFLSYFNETLYNLLFGEAQYTYWYIPVILTLYFISPMIRAVISSKFRGFFIVVAISLPIFFSRTGTDLSFSTLVYFLGGYVVGIVIGEAIDDRLTRIARQVWPFALLAACATLALCYLYATGFDYWGPTSLRESAYYLQKMSLAMLLLVWLWRSSDRLPHFQARVLSLFASAAFALYFIHGFVFRRFVGIAAEVSPLSGSNWHLIIGSAVTFLLGTAACWIIILLLRTILGGRARLLVGT